MGPGANVKKHFTAMCYKVSKLARVVVTGMLFQPSLTFVGRAGAYPRVEHLREALLGQTQVSSTNIRLGWKSLPRTNALAYDENS